jgi:hypothetical protein
MDGTGNVISSGGPLPWEQPDNWKAVWETSRASVEIAPCWSPGHVGRTAFVQASPADQLQRPHDRYNVQPVSDDLARRLVGGGWRGLGSLVYVVHDRIATTG